jgi:hypothetical protein
MPVDSFAANPWGLYHKCTATSGSGRKTAGTTAMRATLAMAARTATAVAVSSAAVSGSAFHVASGAQHFPNAVRVPK